VVYLERRAGGVRPIEPKGGYVNINISTVHGELTPHMKEYALRKVRKIERFLAGGMLEAQVNFSIKDPWVNAEAILKVKNGGTVVAKAREDDVFKAVDSMVDKLERQVKHLKDRRSVNRKRASQRVKSVMMDETVRESFTEEPQAEE